MNSYLSKKIKIVSFVLTVLVLIIHAKNYPEFNLLANNGDIIETFVYYFQEFLSEGIARVAVPMFFIISGFLFFYNMPDYHGGKRVNWFLQKWHKRFFSLIIPFLLWNFIYYMVYLIPKFIPGLRTVIRLYIQDPTLADFLESIIWFKHNSHFWFIGFLIVMVFISPLLYRIIKNKISALIYLLAMIIAYIFFHNINGSLIRGLLFFGFGAFMSLNKEDFELKLRYNRKLFVIGIFIIWIAFNLFNLFIINDYMVRICTLVGIVAVWYLYDIIENKVDVKWFMNYNMILYAAHGIILNMSEKFLIKIFGTSPLVCMSTYLFDIMFVFFIIVGICYVARKYCPKVLGILNGNR